MLRTCLIAAGLAGALGAPAAADHAVHGRHALQSGGTIVVSCFRGPWRETIWDKPEPVFLDSLRAVGYDYAAAESIANRVCRDVTLVGDDAGLKAEMERIVAESPLFRINP